MASIKKTTNKKKTATKNQTSKSAKKKTNNSAIKSNSKASKAKTTKLVDTKKKAPKLTSKTSVKKKASKPKTRKVQNKVIIKKAINSNENVEPLVLPKLKNEVEISKSKVNNKKAINKSKKNNLQKKGKSNAKNIARTKNSEVLSRIKKVQRKIKIYGIESVISKRNMAVIAAGIFVLLFIIVGLNLVTRKDYSIDLEMISSDIDQLKTVAFDMNSVSNIVNESEAFTDIKDYYEYDFEKQFNLKTDWLEEQTIKYNKANNQFFIAIKPTKENESNTRGAIEEFIKTNKIKDYQYLDYDGYQFFINSSNNTAVISKIKQTQIRVFDILKELKKDDIKKTLNISNSLYKDSNVKLSMIVSDTTGYVILKPSNSSAKKEIKEKMNEYFESLKNKWLEKNDIDNLNLVNNRYEGEYNGYLVYIISRDNSLVLQLIQK